MDAEQTATALKAPTSLDRSLALIDVKQMRGLEIGPLHNPRVRKSDGPVSYIDHFSTEELRTHYQANAGTRPHLDEIVDVDFVIRGDMSLADTVGDAAPFDYVIASHVVEHVPNPIGWMREVAQLLHPGGILSLAVPDKRFCFDVNRSETLMRDWIDWYLHGLTRPTFAQMYDFFANVTTVDGGVDTAGIWAGTASYAGVRRPDVPDADRAAYEMCLHQLRTGEYIDVHGSVYTPASFLSLLETTARLGLLDFELAGFFTTQPNTLEFHVSLRRVSDPAADVEKRTVLFRQHIDEEVELAEARERAPYDRLAEERDRAQEEAAAERRRRADAETAVNALTRSRSWRITAPMRHAGSLARRIKQR